MLVMACLAIPLAGTVVRSALPPLALSRSGRAGHAVHDALGMTRLPLPCMSGWLRKFRRLTCCTRCPAAARLAPCSTLQRPSVPTPGRGSRQRAQAQTAHAHPSRGRACLLNLHVL